MRNILKGLSAMGAIIAFILLLGTAGAIDTNSIDDSTGLKNLVIYTALFAVFAIIGLILARKEEE